MTKVLVISDHVEVNSGFGNQTKLICEGLVKAGYDTYHLGLAYHGNPLKVDGVTWLANGETKFGEQALPYWIKKKKPDIVISLLDMWMCSFMHNMDKGNSKWLAYIPMDSESMLPIWKDWLLKYDAPVVFSKFAKKLVYDSIGIEPEHIPHCIDTKLFHPMEEKDRNKLRLQNGIGEDVFNILMVGRNQRRKMQPYLIKAFAKFAKDKPDVRLTLHMDFNDEQLGWNLDNIISNLGIQDKIIRTIPHDGYFYKLNISKEKMNELYNLADVHYNCGNEGFGVPMLEANSCGVPNVSPDYTTANELLDGGNCGILTKLSKEKWFMPNGAEWCIPDTDDLVRAFQELYDDRKKLKELGKKAREHALKYDKETILPMWDKLIKKTLLKEKEIQVDYANRELGI